MDRLQKRKKKDANFRAQNQVLFGFTYPHSYSKRVELKVAYASVERKGAKETSKGVRKQTEGRARHSNWKQANQTLFSTFSPSSSSHLVRDGLVGLDLLRLLCGVGVLARDEQEQRDEAHARKGAGEASHIF